MPEHQDYHGTKLLAAEWTALSDIERVLGQPVPRLKEGYEVYPKNFFGFMPAAGFVDALCLGGSMKPVPETIILFSRLRELYLNANNLSFIPENIGQIQSLQVLHLDMNHLERLPASVGNLTNLLDLDISRNGLQVLPESISQLQSLRQLDLTFNHLYELSEIQTQWVRDLKGRGCKVYGLPPGIT